MLEREFANSQRDTYVSHGGEDFLKIFYLIVLIRTNNKAAQVKYDVQLIYYCELVKGYPTCGQVIVVESSCVLIGKSYVIAIAKAFFILCNYRPPNEEFASC